MSVVARIGAVRRSRLILPTIAMGAVFSHLCRSASQAGVGFAFEFDPANHDPVELQVAISLVSADGAKASLATELPDWSFDDTRAMTTPS